MPSSLLIRSLHSNKIFFGFPEICIGKIGVAISYAGSELLEGQHLYKIILNSD